MKVNNEFISHSHAEPWGISVVLQLTEVGDYEAQNFKLK